MGDQIVDVARPFKKRRKDMKASELSADNAEREFEKARKEVTKSRASMKKDAVELVKIARSIDKEVKGYDKILSRRFFFFEALVKKKIKDSLSLKKEDRYALPLGEVPLAFKNIEFDLFQEFEKKILQSSEDDVNAEDTEEEEDEEVAVQDVVSSGGTQSLDSQLLERTIKFVEQREVKKFNTRHESDGLVEHELDLAAVLKVFKKSNTRGGCFQLKKMNAVNGATVVYDKKTAELKVLLTVVEVTT